MSSAATRKISSRFLHVWRRNFAVYRKTWSVSFMPPLLEPLLYLAAFGFGMSGLVGDVAWAGRPVSYIVFIAPALLSVNMMYNSFFETTYGSFVRMYYQKTFDAMLATPLTIEDVISGELLWGATKSVVAAGIMLVVLSCFGFVHYPGGLWVLPIAAVGGLLFASLGMIATALVPTIEVFNVPIFLVIFPMFVFGGTFFPVEYLPPWARWISMALPLTHISSLVRGATLNRLVPSDLAVGAGFAAAAAALAVVAIAAMRKRLVK